MFLLEYKFEIINYCIKDLNKGYYATKIAKELSLNQKSVSNYLNELEKEGLLLSIFEGRNKIFYFNFQNRSLLIDFLCAFSNIKKIKLLKDNFKIKEILDNLDLDFILIFGSYAKRQETKRSDLDILILGDYDKKQIKKLSILYDIEINVKSFSNINFIKSLNNKDILISEIVKDSILISGYEYFVKNIVKNYYGK